MSDAKSSEIQINIKGPSELKLQITISTDKTVLELKQAISEKSDVPADRQRLIYSGRVLKDEDLLSVYKIQSSHTIHMVKGVARSAASSSTQQTGSTQQSLPTMQAGQNPHDPLTQINSHLGFGALAGFNPFAEMGVNPNDPNMMQTMMSSPQFLEQMSSVMSNPAVLDQIIALNPQLAAIAPQVREVFQSPQFREMMSNPEALRSMLQMASAFRGAGGDPFGSPFGGPAARSGGFPAPGVPSSGTSSSTSPTSTDGQQQQQQQQQPPPPNPFAAFFPPPQPTAAGTGAGAIPPFFDPAMLQRMQSAFGGYGGLGGGFGAPAPPADTRPPEERFQSQLQQLQEMGFTNASQNIRALLATAGNVQAAIEYILSGEKPPYLLHRVALPYSPVVLYSCHSFIMFHFSADRLAGLDSMVLKISASPKVPPIIPNHTLNHNPSTNVKKLRKCNNRRANRTPLADKTTSSNVPPHVPPREKISSSMLLGNLCCAPNELNITPSKQATPPTVRHSLADANSFRPLPPLPSASTLQLPSFLNFSTQSFASPSGVRIQRSTSSLPGSVLFRLSSTPVSSYRRVVIRKTKNKKVYEGPHWIPAFHHPNSPYVPWTTPVRRRILPPPSPSCTSPTPYSDHHSRSGAVAPEPWTADFCSETPKKSRRGKLANSWKKFKNSVKRGVQNVVSCIGKSRKSRVNCATQDVVTPCSENVAIIDSPSPSTRPWSTRSRCSLKSFASSDSTTLAAWLAERRTAASGIADEPGGEVSVEEYELMGSWLDLHQGDGEWVCGVRDCDLHTPGGSPNAIRGRLKVFRTGMPFDGPDLLLTPPQPSTPCPSFSSEFIATPARFWSLPRLPSHAVDMAISTCNGSPASSLDAERRLVNQKSRELTMPGGWTLC